MEAIVKTDLFDIYNKLVVKGGIPVDYKLVRRLMDHGTRLRKVFIPFGETELFKNFVDIFNEEKYFAIFTPYKVNEEIAGAAKKTNLTKELIEELEYMKGNLPYTFRHVLLVTALIIKMSLDLRDKGYDSQFAAIVGLVHDLGKSRIPKQILGKDTPLTQSEYELLKTHPLLSYLLLCYYLGSGFDGIPNAVRDHHEKLDGSGYPRATDKVERYARLITPVDIFDALISERPYRGFSYTIRQAMDYLIDEANTGKIDKEVVYYLISYVRKEHPQPEDLKPYEKKFNNHPPADSNYGKIIPDDNNQTLS